MHEEVVVVGMADMKTLRGPGVLRSTGLGSCVGVALFDKTAGVAGLAHIMLPRAPEAYAFNPAKYADTGTNGLIELLCNIGASTSRMTAKLAGGSQMFAHVSANELLRIGPRNVDEVKRILLGWRIPVISEDTGGNIGRSIEFSVPEGLLSIRTVKRGVKVI